MTKKKRRIYSSEQKAQILRRHMVDKIAVSDLCDEYKLQPSVFYSWQKQLMDNLAVALDATSGKRVRAVSTQDRNLVRQVQTLTAKLAKRDHVIAEISEEHVAQKRELGEP